MGLILFLSGIFLLTYSIGRLLERIRIPWIFSALLIGLGLAAYNPFKQITDSSPFLFLAQLGMYFLLFIIGFELNIKEILEQGSFIFKSTAVIIFTESLFGTLLVHYVFHVSWLISVLVASSFATVGEAVLLPILDEFKLVKTKLGQTILGIGVLDDLVEIVTVVAASIIIGRSAGYGQSNIWTNLIVLGLLFIVVFFLVKFHKIISKKNHLFRFKDISSFFILILFFIFLFIGIGKFAESAALGALLAGIALRNIAPKEKLKFVDSEIRTISCGFFAPIFFVWVGLDTDVGYLIKFPLLVLLVMVMTKFSKITSSYFMGRKTLGTKKSIILGVSLSIKFSTSIVIIKLLFENGIIQSDLYSVLVGTTIAFKFVVPFLLAYLITKWKVGFSRIKSSA